MTSINTCKPQMQQPFRLRQAGLHPQRMAGWNGLARPLALPASLHSFLPVNLSAGLVESDMQRIGHPCAEPSRAGLCGIFLVRQGSGCESGTRLAD
jgi:hypothetical protein